MTTPPRLRSGSVVMPNDASSFGSFHFETAKLPAFAGIEGAR